MFQKAALSKLMSRPHSGINMQMIGEQYESLRNSKRFSKSEKCSIVYAIYTMNI